MSVVKKIVLVVGLFLMLFASLCAYAIYQTESDIDEFRRRVSEIGHTHPAPAYDADQLANLPEPVQRYFKFVFRGPVPAYSVLQVEADGEFRRPLTEGFNPTTAEQVIAVGTPALIYSETISMFPGIWARAYDYYAEGKMEMRAKIESVLTVVDQKETLELNRISLRRWLLESPLYPQALLPGGPVTWQAVSDNCSRALVSAHGQEVSVLAFFNGDGRLVRMTTETDGDLNTPYHGSGEHATRGDYQRVGNQMIPHTFVISRAAKGKVYPFWRGRVTSLNFLPAQAD